MLVYPHIDPVALHLGPLQIHWYGIMYVIGFGVAWWLARRRAADLRSTWTPIDVDDLVFWMMLGVIVGGVWRWMPACVGGAWRWGGGGWWDEMTRRTQTLNRIE